MRQTPISLKEEDRVLIDDIRTKGKHSARQVNRAHVLSCLDRGLSEAHIMMVLGIGRTAIWRTRSAYVEGGVQLAVFDIARPGRPVKYDTNAAAHITALACSQAPAGRTRWTIEQLEKAARTESGLDQISKETVRRILKKATLNLGAK
jgi:transposase